MSVLPTRIQDLLDFFEQHAPVWIAQAASIGLTSEQAAAFETLAEQARNDYRAKLDAIEARKAATLTSGASVRAARGTAADLIALIKAFADNSPDPTAIYTLAQIPPPAAPSPAAPPGVPTGLRAELNTDGSITLRWKAENPSGQSGTVWNVRRKLPAMASPVFIGASGVRSFTDGTLPAGSANAVYTIQGQRGTALGSMSSPFTVQFGVSGGGGMMIAAQWEGGAREAA